MQIQKFHQINIRLEESVIQKIDSERTVRGSISRQEFLRAIIHDYFQARGAKDDKNQGFEILDDEGVKN